MQCHRHPPQPQRPPLLGWPLLPQPPPLLLPCCAAQRCSTAAAWPPHQRPCAAWAHTQENKHSMETRVQLVKQPVDGQQHGRFCKSTTCELLHVKRLQARLLAQDPRQYQCLFPLHKLEKAPQTSRHRPRSPCQRRPTPACAAGLPASRRAPPAPGGSRSGSSRRPGARARRHHLGMKGSWRGGELMCGKEYCKQAPGAGATYNLLTA